MFRLGLSELAILGLICAFCLAPLLGVGIVMLRRRRSGDRDE